MSGKARSASTYRSISSLRTRSSGRFVIQAKSLEARNRLIPKLQQFGREQFVGIDIFVHTLETLGRRSDARSNTG